MKFALRAFAMFIVVAGLLAAAAPSVASPATVSAAMIGPGPLGLPAPGCGPGIPTCQPNPPSGGGNLQ